MGESQAARANGGFMIGAYRYEILKGFVFAYLFPKTTSDFLSFNSGYQKFAKIRG